MPHREGACQSGQGRLTVDRVLPGGREVGQQALIGCGLAPEPGGGLQVAPGQAQGGKTGQPVCRPGIPGLDDPAQQAGIPLQVDGQVIQSPLGSDHVGQQDQHLVADQVPEAVKQERLDRLMTLQQGISLERNRLRVDRTERALVERVREDGVAVARTQAEAPDSDGLLYLQNGAEAQPGTFVTARITGADVYDLTGVIV